MVFATSNETNRRGRQPDETQQLTKSLSASFWRADTDGGTRFHWDIARIGENGRTFKTKRVEDVLELVQFGCRLAEILANSSAVESGLRKRLAAMSVALSEVIEVLNSSDVNGEAKSDPGAASIFG